MKILKWIIAVIVLIMILFLLIGLVAPKTIKVEKSIQVNAPASEVYDYVSSLSKLTESTVWQDIDPNVVKSFSGPDNEVGGVYRWESDHKHVGVGEQKIIELVPNEKVVHELHFIEPMESTDQATFFLEESDGGTNLTWDYESSKIPFPGNAFVAIAVTPKLKKQFEESLSNIKAAVES